MSKKKNKKDCIPDLVSMGIRILKSGKLKLSKGYVISMDELSKDAIANTIGSRYEALEDNSAVSSDTSKKGEVCGQWCSLMKTYRMMSKVDEAGNEELTIVYPIARKHASEIFDYAGSTVIGQLLRISNLGTIYNAVHENWTNLLKASKSMDCLLYIPGITIFADDELRIFTEKQTKVNLLLFVVRGKVSEAPDFLEDEEKPETDNSTVADRVLDSAVKLGCTNLLVDPLSFKNYQKDVREAGKEWKKAVEDESNATHLHTVTFCVEDDDDFIVFWKNLDKHE